MKKFILLILTIVFVVMFSACSSDSSKNHVEKETTTQVKDTTDDVAVNDKDADDEVGANTNDLTPEEVTKKYYEAMANLDYETIFDLCVDSYAIESAISSGKFKDKDEFCQDFAEEFAEEYEDTILALGDNRTVSNFEVIEITDIPEDEMVGDFKYVFSEGDESYPVGSVSSSKVVTAAITISGDQDEISVQSCNTPLIQIDGKWHVATYLMSISGGKVQN